MLTGEETAETNCACFSFQALHFAVYRLHSIVLLRYRASDETNRHCKNRSFPSSLVPLFQNESKCENLSYENEFCCSFIFMQIKVIFIRMVSHLDSL